MNTKLTLSMDKKIIEAAKKYARKKKVSLSSLIQNYLTSLTTTSKSPREEISPLVKSLSGVLKLDSKKNYKKGYSDYLAKKYK